MMKSFLKRKQRIVIESFSVSPNLQFIVLDNGKFASGKDAYGISDRSGFRYRLRDMRKEWNGLLVGKDEWEEKHPQIQPVRHAIDAEALRDPRPDTNNIIGATVSFPAFNLTTLLFQPLIPEMRGQIGTVTFGGNVITPTSAIVTSVTGTGLVGTVTASGTGTSIAATFTITVASYLGANKYYINGVRQATVSLSEGSTYSLISLIVAILVIL